MTKITPKIIKDPEKKTDIIGWLSIADDDYIAARVLIDNGLLAQGAILSATSIEKYLKMIGRIHEVRFQLRGDPHNVLDLYTSLKKNGATFNLNEDYLRFLVKIYRFRYPDKLESDYSFAINQTKLMVAIDESVFILRNRIQIIDEKGEEKKNSRIHMMTQHNDMRLMRCNHAFADIKREYLFVKPSLWHEMRFVNGKAWMETHYTGNVEDDGVHNLLGMEQGENDRQFKLKSEPIDLIEK